MDHARGSGTSLPTNMMGLADEHPRRSYPSGLISLPQSDKPRYAAIALRSGVVQLDTGDVAGIFDQLQVGSAGATWLTTMDRKSAKGFAFTSEQGP